MNRLVLTYPFREPTPEQRLNELFHILCEFTKPPKSVVQALPWIRDPDRRESFSRSELHEAMTVMWPVGFSPPTDTEMKNCLRKCLSEKLLERWRDPKAPPSKWMEPRFRPVLTTYTLVNTAPRQKIQVKSPTRLEAKYPRLDHECTRCGAKIRGKGRHQKSVRGHDRVECDAKMVEKIMQV